MSVGCSDRAFQNSKLMMLDSPNKCIFCSIHNSSILRSLKVKAEFILILLCIPKTYFS